MNATILRTPQIVPSLFSRGEDRDDVLPGASATQRLAARSRRARRAVTSAAIHHVPALAAYSGLLVIIGKPLCRVAALAMGVTP